MYQRDAYKTLSQRIESEKRKFIQVVLGPRQVGKTTMIQQLLKQIKLPYHTASADGLGADASIWIEQNWEAARIQKKIKNSEEFVLVLDEIQNVPQWSEQVKKQWDLDTKNENQIKVILSGSSRLLLQNGLNESLAGRFETIIMTHWSFSEIHSAFGLDESEYAWYGGYPAAADLIHDEDRWKQYIRHSIIDTVVKKDILQLTRINKPALLEQLFYVGAINSSNILSYTKIIGQLQDAGNTTTLKHYVNLLDSAGLLAGLDKYSKNIVYQRASIPKFQVYNTAFLGALKGEDFDISKQLPQRWGHVVESCIGAHLLNQSMKYNMRLFYWREGNNEVDFVLEWQDKTIAIEVKSTASHQKKGLAAFRDAFNPHKIYLIEDHSFSWKDFIKIEATELF